MLSTISRRLHAAYLRWLLRHAEQDVLITKVEMATAPVRLGVYEGHAAKLRARIQQLENSYADGVASAR